VHPEKFLRIGSGQLGDRNIWPIKIHSAAKVVILEQVKKEGHREPFWARFA